MFLVPAPPRTRSHIVPLFDQDSYDHDQPALSLRTEIAIGVVNSASLLSSPSSFSPLGPASLLHLEQLFLSIYSIASNFGLRKADEPLSLLTHVAFF